MTVKKVFQPIIDLLNANPSKKVSEILAEVTAIASAKTARIEGNVFLKNDKGETVAIFDYYFKRWMPLVGDKKVEFGAKAGTATGFSSMSKAGTSAWTKQQSDAKKAGQELLVNVSKGSVKPDQILAEQAKIEEARKAIAPTDLGFATLEELNTYLKANKVVLASGDSPKAEVKATKAA